MTSWHAEEYCRTQALHRVPLFDRATKWCLFVLAIDLLAVAWVIWTAGG